MVTKFMPSTFMDYAKDGDGDGRNIWGSAAVPESAANFVDHVETDCGGDVRSPSPRN